MIRNLSVERFKSLVKVDSLELGRINVFIGANGSGKSNLLEALGVLSAAAFGRVDDETLLRRGVRPGVPRLYKTAFPMRSGVPHIFFGATTESGATLEVTLWNPIDNPSPAWRFKTEKLLRNYTEEVVTRSTTTTGKHNQEQGLAALQTVNLKPGDAVLLLMDQLRHYSIHCPNTPKSTEAWVVAALFPSDRAMHQQVECYTHPESRLGQQPKSKRIRKKKRDYEAHATDLKNAWSRLVAPGALGEARRFQDEFLATLATVDAQRHNRQV
ncbi:MAG: AAA family ATPase [Verrucomicrobia bacterium]|nr:AAA family ATPase [Verrucomicrobiota bacterium]